MSVKQYFCTEHFLCIIAIISTIVTNTIVAQNQGQSSDITTTVISTVGQAQVTTIKPIKLEDSNIANLVAEQTGNTQKKIAVTSKTLDKTSQKSKFVREDALKNIPNPEQIPVKTVGDNIEMVICSSLPLTGDDAQLGKQINDGMNLFFNTLKKKKDVTRFVKLYVLDDQSDFIIGKTNLTKLLQQSPALLNLFGSDVLLSNGKKLIESKKIAALFPMESLDILRKETYAQTIYLRASHEDELKALAHHAITELNHKKFAVFYEASDWGEAVLQSLKKVLETYDLKLLAEASYPQGTVNVSDAVSKISKASPNAIFCIAQSRPAYSFILKAIDAGMYKSIFLGLSNLLSIQKNIQKSLGVKLIASSVLPDPQKSPLPLAKQYRDDMKKYLPNRQLSPYSFESYVNAVLFYQGIQKMSEPFSIKKLISELEGITDIQGLKLSFDKKTRTLSHQVWISDGSEKEWFIVNQQDIPNEHKYEKNSNR